jgi:hypothetical protein
MSLTDFVSWDRQDFDIYFTKPPCDLSGQLIAQSLTKNYTTVGTSFDYAMRLILSKLNTNCLVDYFDTVNCGNKYIKDTEYYPMVAELGAKTKKRKKFIADFLNKKALYLKDKLMIKDLLSDCIILAKLESNYRSGKDYPDSDIFSFNDDDVKDLSNLVNAINPTLFKTTDRLVLNPIFGKSSAYIGGADADFIMDDTLVDIKVTKYLRFTAEQFRQLIGYWWLDQREHKLYGFNKLAIYYARYGVLFTLPDLNDIVFRLNEWEDTSSCQWLEEDLIEYHNLITK